MWPAIDHHNNSIMLNRTAWLICKYLSFNQASNLTLKSMGGGAKLAPLPYFAYLNQILLKDLAR